MERAVRALGALKLLPRTGWVLRGVPPAVAETVADHTFEAAVTAYLLAKRLRGAGVPVDAGRAAVIALLHDLEEAVIGDLLKPVKRRLRGVDELSREAMEALGLAEEGELVAEYHEGRTPEALVVKLADLVATLNQACRYLEQGYSGVRDLVENVSREIQEVLEEAPHARRAVEELVLCGPLRGGRP